MRAYNRIAVFDDYPNGRERWSDTIRVMGLEPFPVNQAPPLSAIAEFLESNQISEVISDHRLSERRYANYSGAELVKACYMAKVGAVLLTNWTRQDADTTLRTHRRWLPIVIDTQQMDVPNAEVRAALKQADEEVRQGLIPRQREPFRTVMSVARIDTLAGREIVRVLMGQWKPNQEVGFPLDMIPEAIRKVVKPNGLLIAQVNLDAERVEDLYFDNFELPDLDAFSNSQAFFDHP